MQNQDLSYPTFLSTRINIEFHKIAQRELCHRFTVKTIKQDNTYPINQVSEKCFLTVKT
jgi:hypothetical protein